MIKLLNIDCMQHMRETADNYYDLAICDPPYFKGVGSKAFFGSKTSSSLRDYWKDNINTEMWDAGVPSTDYITELKRVSKHQIIWGINYFDFSNVVGSGRIVWDKKNCGSSFSHCEIASCSLIDSVKIFRYAWSGFVQENMKHKQAKIHPTQKPIELYEWLLDRYAKLGDKILDTHSGSGSSAIAAANFGFDYVGCELDAKMCEKSQKRLEEHIKQGRLI